MALKTYRPLTPVSRFKALPSFEEITKTKPEKALVRTLKKTGGRNNRGRLTSRHIGGGHSARGMYTWARMHGLTSRSNPQIGDIAIYGNGTHAAIYIGHGRVVSALNRRVGIRVTSLHALTAPFTTFIHTHI